MHSPHPEQEVEAYEQTGVLFILVPVMPPFTPEIFTFYSIKNRFKKSNIYQQQIINLFLNNPWQLTKNKRNLNTDVFGFVYGFKS